MRGQPNRAWVTGVGVAVDEDMQLGTGVGAQRAGLSGTERLAPDVKELPKGEGRRSWRLDVDDPIGRMRMHPVEALLVLNYSDPSGEGDGRPVVDQIQMSVEVCLDRLGFAVDAVDG